MTEREEQLVSLLGRERIAVGTVADAIRQVERLKAAGADEILFLVQMGTVPHEATMTTIRNIGQHLIPHFR